jgi:hypothetical protein
LSRALGYRGTTFMELPKLIDELAKTFPEAKVESAIYHLTTFEGQMTAKPPPLAKVMFRGHVRPLLWQLLGPPPEKEDAFWRHPDGTPMERPKQEPELPPEPVAEEPRPAKKRARKKG